MDQAFPRGRIRWRISRPYHLTSFAPIIRVFDELHGFATYRTCLPNANAAGCSTIHPPFVLSYNYIAPATRAEGSKVLVKADVPNDSLTDEIKTLRVWNAYRLPCRRTVPRPAANPGMEFGSGNIVGC